MVTTSTYLLSTMSELSSVLSMSSNSPTLLSNKLVLASYALIPRTWSLTIGSSQVNTLHADAAGGGADTSGGPLWGRFFAAAADAGGDDDTESMVSGTGVSDSVQSSQAPFSTPQRPSHHRSKDSIDTPGSELFPGDSASVMNDDGASDVGGSRRAPGASSIGGAAPSQIVDDGTYLFKFVAPGGSTHRFQARYDSHEFLTDIVTGKLSSDPFFSTPTPSEDSTAPPPAVADPSDFQLSYRDDDGDLVMMTHDGDVTDAVATAKAQGKDRVVLIVSGGQTWKAVQKEQDAPAVSITKKLVIVEEGDEDKEESESAAVEKPKKRSTASNSGDELVGGFLPKEYLLPASIGFLGVVIAAVFIASRASGSAR